MYKMVNITVNERNVEEVKQIQDALDEIKKPKIILTVEELVGIDDEKIVEILSGIIDYIRFQSKIIENNMNFIFKEK